MRARGIGAFADGAQRRGPSACARAPTRRRGASATPTRNSSVDLQRRRAPAATSLQQPERDRRQARRGRLDQRLAEEKRQPDAEQHQRDADRDVVDARAAAQPARAARRAATPTHARGQHAEPRRAGQVRDAVAAHGAHDQRALEAQVHAAALLGDALAQAHEQERRADAQRAAEHRERHAPEAELVPQLPSPWLRPHSRHRRAANQLPSGERLAATRCTTKRMPCSTLTVASGRSNGAAQAAAGADAAEQDATAMRPSGLLARQERDQDARVAVARRRAKRWRCRARQRPRPRRPARRAARRRHR